MPDISVVTPTLNRSLLLERLWKSLNDQQVDFEWIVIDDGSTDDTQRVVKSFQDARIVYSKLDKNMGVNFARNAGVRLSRSDYVIFLDSDDEVVVNALAVALERTKATPENIGVVCFACVMADTGRRTSKLVDGAILGEKRIVCQEALRGGENVYIYKRKIFKDFELPSHLKGCEHVFVYGISKKWDFLVVDTPLRLMHRQSDNLSGASSLVARSKDIAKSFELILENHSVILENNPSAKTALIRKSIYRYGVAGAKFDVLRLTSLGMQNGSIFERTKTLVLSLFSMLPIAGLEFWRISRVNKRLEKGCE